MCTELYGDWSLHNQYFSGINDFLSLTEKIENCLFEVLMMFFS